MRFVYELIVKRAPKEAWIAAERINGGPSFSPAPPEPGLPPDLLQLLCHALFAKGHILRSLCMGPRPDARSRPCPSRSVHGPARGPGDRRRHAQARGRSSGLVLSAVIASVDTLWR